MFSATVKYRKSDQFGRFVIILPVSRNVIIKGHIAMRTQIKATRLSGRLCVLGLITFLSGYFIGCTGEQPADNVEPGKKATSSPDQNRELTEKDVTEKDVTEKDVMEKDVMEKGMMKKGMMKKGMMKKGMMKKDMMKKDMMKKDMMKKGMMKTNSGASSS